MYMYGGKCAIIVAHATQRNVSELGHSHFLYVPAVSNVVTNGNGTGTKNVLKGTVLFGLSLVSSIPLTGATSVAKVKLFSTWTRSTVSFYSM